MSKKKYYFMSYNFGNNNCTGFGSGTIGFDGNFDFPSTIEKIKEQQNYNKVVIMYFTEITKKQYKDFAKLI